jgi:hypothetical protein
MFISDNIPALFKKGTLKLQDNGDGGLRRVAEATLVIEPFPAQLAHELGEEIAGHLFTDDGLIRDELESIDLRVRCGLQKATVRLDEALDPEAIIHPASIKDVNVSRVDAKKSQRSWLSCSFVLVFSLEEREARNFVLDQFGKTLLWSFRGMQADLLQEARLHEAIARVADPAGDGSVTVSIGVNGGELIPLDMKKHRDRAKALRDEPEKTH